jgi:hypothetical protein
VLFSIVVFVSAGLVDLYVRIVSQTTWAYRKEIGVKVSRDCKQYGSQDGLRKNRRFFTCCGVRSVEGSMGW